MGNLQTKERIDLSPRTLTLTSVDDKVWLGIPEENLFNDSFTIEKYYMLQSKPLSNFKDADHFKSIEQIEQSFFPSYKDRFTEISDDSANNTTDQKNTGGDQQSKSTGAASSSSNEPNKSGNTANTGNNPSNGKPSSIPTSASTMTLVNNNNNSNNNNNNNSNVQQNSRNSNNNSNNNSGTNNNNTNNPRNSGPTVVNNNRNSTNNVGQSSSSPSGSNNNNSSSGGSGGKRKSTQPNSNANSQQQQQQQQQQSGSSSNNQSSGTGVNPNSSTGVQSTTANNSSSTSSSAAATTTPSKPINNNPFHEEFKNRQNIPVYLIDEDPFHTHQITTTLILEDLYSQSNVNTAYYSTLLQKRLCILKRIHLALKREIARKKLFDSVYHSKAKTRTKKVHTPPISIRIACRLFITTLQEQVFEQRISLPTLKSFNSMIRELPPLSMAGEPQDCIDSLTKWLLSAITTNIIYIKREAMESLISLALSQGALSSILFALSLIIMPDKQQQILIQQPLSQQQQQQQSQQNNNSTSNKSNSSSNLSNLTNGINNTNNNSSGNNNSNANNRHPPHISTFKNQQSNNVGHSSSMGSIPESIHNFNEPISNTNNNQEPVTLRLIPFIRQLEQWKVDLPLSPLSRDLLFATWPILWNDNASEDSLSFLSSPNTNIATITSDGDYIYIHDTCGLAKIGTGYFGTHQGRIYARNGHFYPKEKGWLASVGSHLYYRSPSTDPSSLIVIDTITLQEVGRINQDGSGSFPTTNNLTLPFGPETVQSSVDESIFLTPHYQITTRSPMFTDGRYIYILTLQRFHSYNNKQFIVDMYDPFTGFKHIKRIELRYPDSDVNEELVLNPIVLELGSFYTNGHYLMVVLPPPLGTDYNFDSKSYICRAFSLSDGSLVGNYCLENQPIGITSTYDYVNNVIWNYSSSESEIGRYGNEGFGPKHNFPVILSRTTTTSNSSTTNNSSNTSSSSGSGSGGSGANGGSQTTTSATTTSSTSISTTSTTTSNTTMISTTITTSMVESDDNQGMEPKQVVSTVLGILSRLAVDYMPSISENSSHASASTIHHLYKLNEPYSVEVNFNTFSQLYSILKHYQGQLRIGYSLTSPKTIDVLRCIIYCLRLLKVNLFRLTSNIRSLERSQQHYQDSSRDSLLKCIDQTFLHQLRDLLLGFVIDGVEGTSTNNSQSTPSLVKQQSMSALPQQQQSNNKEILPEFNSIMEESCEVLTIGLDLFYPTSLDKANFVKTLLEQVMNHRKAGMASIPGTKPTKEKEREKGYSMLLNSVLSLLANHPNASFFALPPLLSEIPSPFSVFNFEGTEYQQSDKPFDPLNLFVPIIKHLLMEAQATIPKQSIPQLSRHDSTQSHLGFSFFSSAPPPPLSTSSPAMRLLLAIQKDLILRVENSIVGTDAPSQALVAYSRLLMDKCKELLLGVLDSESTQRNQSILLTDFKSSVVGALLPTLIHSLFLFSYHIWLAKELLPSLIPLIGVVDRVNRRLPKLLNRPELGRQPLQKRSSFVEGPSRISESPHPYHPFMNTRQLVSIPGAVFLSLVFDERSSTSTSDDLLQIFESADSKEPIDQFSLSQWPKRRILIPGDTVVFQFITGSASGASNPYAFWGYRCNIIGHMPNSDKTSLPWSSHLEKTMCCLAGRFSASLISGDPLSDLELENKAILESPLFSGGVEEEYVSHVLFGTESNITASPHPNPQPQPYPIDSLAGGVSTMTPQSKATQRFLVSLAKRSGEIFSQSLADFMWQHITGEKVRGKGNIRTAQQAVIAAMLKHLGLGELAMNFALEVMTMKSREMAASAAAAAASSSEDNNSAPQPQQPAHVEPQPKPPQQLIDVWKSVGQIRASIIQRHQENTNNVINSNAGGSAPEDETAKRRSIHAHATLRETIYKDITDKLIEKAMFLLELQSLFSENENILATTAKDPERATLNAQVWNEIVTSVNSFVLSNVLLDDIKKILVGRRSRAYTRSIGLMAMIDILRCASDHTMKHEALCYIGPALRNSGLVKQRSPPFHYLDHLQGCGSRLFKDIKRNFRALMEDIASLLQDPNSDYTLKLYALDAFTLNFTSEDADLLTSVDIFNKIHGLMTNDSIWGGLWSSSHSVMSAQVQSPIHSVLLHSQSSSSIGSGGSSSSNLFSNTNNYSGFVEEEKLEKEKLKRNAKALFRFLGLICVDGGPNNNNKQTSMTNSMMSLLGTSNKSLEILRDAFFHIMETQLDSSLVYLQEQNKTYWQGSDLPAAVSSPPTSITNKGRRIMRGERTNINYDFSDGLSLLYILGAFNSVKQRLISPSFLHIFHCILQVGDETHRKLTLRIFRRILPYAAPNKLIVSSKRSNSTSSTPPTSASTSSPLSSSSSTSTLNSTPSSTPTSTTNSTSNSSSSTTSSTPNSKNLFSLLLDIVGAISYWGCSSDLLDTSKYIDPRFFITSSNYNLFFSNNYSTKFDSSHSYFSMFDKSTVFPTCWDNTSYSGASTMLRFSNDAKLTTFSGNSNEMSPIVRSDNVIPENVPLFYFEVKIENDNNDSKDINCIVGLFPMNHVAQLRSLRDWKYGYGFSARDGHKVCHRINGYRSRIYGSTFTRGDVIGCGWNRKEGKIFFTKNGKYLGTAFKNVYGDYYPAVQLGSGVSLSVNFGHVIPFLYDMTPLISSHLDLSITEKNQPSMALSYVSEVVSLLRLLLRAPLWKPSLQKYIEDGLKLLPSTIVLETMKPTAPPSTQSLLHVFSTITLLAGHLDGIWVGSRVQVDLGSGRFEQGTVIEYSPISNLSRVLLDNNIPKLSKTVHHRRNLKPITEINIDFSQFLPSLSSVLPSLSVFLRPTTTSVPPLSTGGNGGSGSGSSTSLSASTPNVSSLSSASSSSSSSKHQSATLATLIFRTNQRNIYLFIKSRVMKILGSLLKYPECAKYTLDEILIPILVEFALGRPIQFLDEPKIEKMERLSFILKERIYDTSFKLFITGESSNAATAAGTMTTSIKSSAADNYDEPPITELDIDEDNEMIEAEEFDEYGVIDLEGDDSLDSNRNQDEDHSGSGSRGNSLSGHQKKGSDVKSRQNSTNASNNHHASGNPEDEVEQNVTSSNNDDDENIAEDDIPEEGIPGKRIPWAEIQTGMCVMVNKREKLGLCRSNWVLDMDRIIGSVGIVKNIDKKHKQVLVTVLDEDTFSLVDWWLCYEILIHPPTSDRSLKNPLQSIEKYSQAQLVQLDASSEMALSILFARQALISLLVSLPNNIKVSYSSFGGAKNLIYILKLTLHTSLLNSFGVAGKTLNTNVNITKLFSGVTNNLNMHKDIQNLKLLQSKLTSLVRQETQQHQHHLEAPSSNNSETNSNSSSGSGSGKKSSSSDKLEKSLSASEKTLISLSSSMTLPTSLSVSVDQASSNSLSASAEGTTKWKSYKPPVLGVNSGLGEPLKTGNLMKQQKIIKLWKRVFVVLSSDALFYYKSQSQTLQNSSTIGSSAGPSGLSFSKDSLSLSPIGSIDLRDIVSVAQVSVPKQNKLFNKKDYCFQITVASNKTHLFQAPSQEELNDWLQIINSACISSASFRSKSNTLSSNSLVEMLVKECSLQLRETAHEQLPHLNEESPHPYPPNYKCKKIIRIEGALSLLIVFDSKTVTEPGYGVLKFFYDPCCTDLIASFSGRIASFPPTLVNAGQFWMIFNSDSPNSDWGYKFTVTPIRMRTSDVSLLPNPNFEFACFLVDWALQLEPTHFTTRYPYFFSSDLIELMMHHLDNNQPLDRKLKVINFLTRVLQKQREAPMAIPQNTTKLDHLKEEMFKLYRFETQLGTAGYTVLSQYLQRLIELCIHSDINKVHWQTINFDQSTSSSSSASSSSSNTNNFNPNGPTIGSSSLVASSNNIGNNSMNNSNSLGANSTSVSNHLEESRAWFHRNIKTYKVLENLFKGKGFNREFIKEAFTDTRNKQVVDSPHPYPQGVRVTANIMIQNAVSLKVEFEPKSKTQAYVDYLMFSRLTPGGDDLGFFTGDFPTQPVFITGDRFIWSFYSDSNESEWGFRFTVTPIFTEETQKEHEIQYEQEIEYLLTQPWNHSLDLELIKFVNTVCEKQKKTPSQLIFEQCCTPEYLILFPLLNEVENQIVLYLRFIILKHFNVCCQQFLQFVDLRGASEDWSIAYRLCSLRGLLFYDLKLEVLGNSLQNARTFGRRPIVYLNRHGSLYGGPTTSIQQPLGNRYSHHVSTNLNNNTELFNLLQQQSQQIHQHHHQQQHLLLQHQQSAHHHQPESLFLQLFRQIGMIDPSRLRHNDRAFEVKLEREGARDAGGPYRESITQIISEIQSSEMNLFLQCHNAQGDVAFNRDKLVPNSSENSPFSLKLYEFIGKLIGIAIRTKNCIELSFPSIFWKSLVCAKVDRQDIEAIDKYTTNLFEMMEKSPTGRNSLDQEMFNELIFQNFTTRSIDNSVVDLIQDGKNQSVTWSNRLEFVKLLELYKLNEFKLQIDSMVKGVASIVPLHMLNIYTWQELEMRVCGMPGLDLKLLKRHTRYYGLSSNEPRVVWFWRTLESFSSEEQTLFLRFVWGRSRLPPSNEFNFQFQLQVFIRNESTFYDDDYEGASSRMSIDENQDEYLPEAQTCFFTLTLPNYSSQEIMREKLLYAITTCRDIDADFIIPDDITPTLNGNNIME